MMMAYIHACLLPVPSENKAECKGFSENFAKVIKEYGAIKFIERRGEDNPKGKLTSLPFAVMLEPNVTLVLSWIYSPDKASRETGMQQSMQDARLQPEYAPMAFGGKRMMFGGFGWLVEL